MFGSVYSIKDRGFVNKNKIGICRSRVGPKESGLACGPTDAPGAGIDGRV